MKQMEVTIMGQSYLLGCPEGGEGRAEQGSGGGQGDVRHPRLGQDQGAVSALRCWQH